MTNKEKAAALWAVVMDRLGTNAEHRAALDELLLLKKAAKVSLDKLGVPQVMWDHEDATNRRNAELAADLKAHIANPDVQVKPKPSAMPALTAGLRAILGGSTAAMGAAVAAAHAPTEALKESFLKAEAKLKADECPKALKFTDDEQHKLDSAHMGAGPEGQDLTKDDFVMTDEELAKQKGRKVFDATTEATLDALSPEVKALASSEPMAPDAGKPSAEERGAISKTVRHMLLNTDHPYALMVDLIKAKHPTAKTTARSIASVASDLRRAKFAVRERRKDAL